MGEEKKGAIPQPAAPSLVRMSKLPPPEVTPTPKSVLAVEKEDIVKGGEKKEVEKEKKVVGVEEKEPLGVIEIRLYERRPFVVIFTGVITGHQLDLAWRRMMKEYRVWKHTLSKDTGKKESVGSKELGEKKGK